MFLYKIFIITLVFSIFNIYTIASPKYEYKLEEQERRENEHELEKRSNVT